MHYSCITALQWVTRLAAVFEGLLSEFRAVNRLIYCPELVPGSKNMFIARNFTFSVHVDISNLEIHMVKSSIFQTLLSSFMYNSSVSHIANMHFVIK